MASYVDKQEQEEGNKTIEQDQCASVGRERDTYLRTDAEPMQNSPFSETCMVPLRTSHK